jgi:hypothetical protein
VDSLIDRPPAALPLALVSAQSVISPVSSSIAMWALNPSWRRDTVLCT